MKKLLLTIFLGAAAFSPAQTPSNYPTLSSLPIFPLATSNLSIARVAVPSQPMSVIGPRGAFLGAQDGSFESWLFPWKILSGLRRDAGLSGTD
jgi:hypothetical protein